MAVIAIYQRTQKIARRMGWFIFSIYHELSKFYENAEQSMSVRLKIIAAIQQSAVEQKVTLPPLEDSLSLHETGFDSLAFAILVARLEDELGIDPFTMSAEATFPLTIGNFIKAYENVPARSFRAARLSRFGPQGPPAIGRAWLGAADRYHRAHLARRQAG